MQQDNQQLNPDIFKQRILQAHPGGVASDGTPYEKMDSLELTKRVISKYPDGVTKDGHKYSDFLPKEQPQQDQNQPSTGFWGGVGNVLNSIEKPFIGAAAIPVQALAKLTGQPDPYAEGFPGLNNQKIDVTPLEAEKKAGDLAQVGSYFIPGEGPLGAIGMGALQGAGGAMSEGGDAATVATQGVLGGAVGGAAAGLTKLTGGALKSVGGLINGEGAQKAVQGFKDAYTSILNLGVGERSFEQRSGKDIAQVLLENKAPLGRYADGTLDASKAVEKLQSALKPLNDEANNLAQNPQGIVKNISINDSLDQLVKNIKSKNLDPLEEESAIKHANDLFDAVKRRYGTDDLNPAQAEQLKQALQGSAFKGKLTSVDKLQSNINYLASDVMKTNLEDALSGTDTDVSFKELNKKRSDLIDAIKRLTGMDGVKLLKGGKLGNMASGGIGALAGVASGAGPLGALAGDYFGTKAGEFLQNPATKIATAEAKSKVAGMLPKIFGESSKPIGNTLSKVGNIVRKGARGAGLIGNLVTK